MTKIAIVDDDKIFLNKLFAIVNESFIELKEIITFDDSMLFFNNPDKFSFDLIFLDIDMPGINGFDIAENLNMIKIGVAIIFVSSKEHLVFDSFKYKPFRFVRKSNLDKDLHNAILDYEDKIRNDRKTYLLKTNEVEKAIALQDIEYFESVKHDVFVQTISHRFKLKRSKDEVKSIKAIHEMLADSGFIRVHKSFLVNFKFIYAIKRNQVILKDNTIIDMNPHNASEIKRIYNCFLIMEN
jgi:DNA-binding LytR/AlgR family response regulator